MKDTKCINCLEVERCKNSRISWVFVVIGLIATLSLRLVTVLTHLAPVYGKAAWYTGVLGFFIFFAYKFRITQSRSKLIKQKGLLDVLQRQSLLTKEDYTLIKDILCSISSNQEKINYFFIFVLSAITLILAAYFDFIR